MGATPSGNKTHDDACRAAEVTLQHTISNTSSQSALNTAYIAYHRACLASAKANGIQPGVFIQALYDLGVPASYTAHRAMNASTQKRSRSKRRELMPLPAVDGTEWGPCMKALACDKHRMFVLSFYQVKPGYGANVKAAKLAGFGTETSSAKSWSVIASRLAHDEKSLAAIREMDEKMIRSSAPRAIRALSSLIETPSHKDHARGIAMVLDRTMPLETVHNVQVKHGVTTDFKETAEVMARIAELAAKFAVPLPAPRVIEGKTEISEVAQ